MNYKKLSKEKLKEVIEKHKKWLNGDIGGKCADLIYKDLSEVNLKNVDLSCANLRNTDLSCADLRNTDLSWADLSYSNLSCANLSDTDLSNANLTGANLIGANLNDTNLNSTNLMYSKTNDRFITFSCIGRAKRMTTYNFNKDIVWCGCFKGALDEFEVRVKETHAKNEVYLKEYLGAINYIRSLK